MQKTWKPTTAGILSIISGALTLLAGLAVALLGTFAGAFGSLVLGGVFAGIAVVPIILGIVSIVGGIYALRRRFWGLALAGSICALSCWILGIPAIIFVVLSKDEFSK
jgi:uncharacterized membrane protein HdeD (DUF308 family)